MRLVGLLNDFFRVCRFNRSTESPDTCSMLRFALSVVLQCLRLRPVSPMLFAGVSLYGDS